MMQSSERYEWRQLPMRCLHLRKNTPGDLVALLGFPVLRVALCGALGAARLLNQPAFFVLRKTSGWPLSLAENCSVAPKWRHRHGRKPASAAAAVWKYRQFFSFTAGAGGIERQ